MPRSRALLSVWFALLASASVAARAEIPVKTEDFATRLVAAKPTGEKTFACFTRRYDAAHLGRHPQQKVSAMKLLVSVEKQPDQEELGYSFRLGVKFRGRAGNFDTAGECGDARASEVREGIALRCFVDCDGGGVDVALAPDDKSLTIKVDAIRIFPAGADDEDDHEMLEGGTDDRVFRLDRADIEACKSLADGEELAAMRHK